MPHTVLGRLVRARYDDGGLSGASLDRPALQQLLDHVGRGKIDVIAVYKVDRLTRSPAEVRQEPRVQLLNAVPSRSRSPGVLSADQDGMRGSSLDNWQWQRLGRLGSLEEPATNRQPVCQASGQKTDATLSRPMI
jgi:hypothetical protein